jgi:hypothetical protein
MTKAHRLKVRERTGFSPNRLAARNRSAMASLSLKGMDPLRINFLLGCSNGELGSYELARLAMLADLRSEVQEKIDKLIEITSQLSVIRWFRNTDRDALKRSLENEESAIEWAKRVIREQGRRGGKKDEQEFLPLPSLTPGAAHLAAALRYQQRNISEGKCAICPKPLDRNSVRFCSKHLAMSLATARQKKALRSDPGSREYLYSGEVTPTTHGRQPGTLASLAMAREKKTRALLAELGIPPESAAVSLRAVKEAILVHVPNSKSSAMSQSELFEKALVPSRATGQKALKELISAKQIQRVGRGIEGDVYRYFRF